MSFCFYFNCSGGVCLRRAPHDYHPAPKTHMRVSERASARTEEKDAHSVCVRVKAG